MNQPVSQICNLVFVPSISMFFILKSIPIVVIYDSEKESQVYRRSMHVFPTPESPSMSNLMCRSKS